MKVEEGGRIATASSAQKGSVLLFATVNKTRIGRE